MLFLPFCVGFYGWSLFCNVMLSVIFLFCNHRAEEERTGCITLVVLLLSSGYLCTVSLPR